MTKGSGTTYSATIGKFASVNVDKDSTLLLTITARDNAGNQSTKSVSVTLRDCFFG